MSPFMFSRAYVLRAMFCGVFAVATIVAMGANVAAQSPAVPTLKTVVASDTETVFTYEYSGTPAASFTMRMPENASVIVPANGERWNHDPVEIVDNGDGTFDAHVENRAGATTGKLRVTVTAPNNLLSPEMTKVYINLGDLAENSGSLSRYIKVTNRTGIVIPSGTVLQFPRNQKPALVVKVSSDLSGGTAYCVVGAERRVAIENNVKTDLAPWLPVAFGGGTVEFRMAETWNFTLKNLGINNLEYEFIDLREDFEVFPPANGKANIRAGEDKIAFTSTPKAGERVLWSVSATPITVSDHATAENWADFLQAFTNNAETLCRAKNTKPKPANDNCGDDPYCSFRNALDNPQFKAIFKAKSLRLKNSAQNSGDLVAFLKDAKSWVDQYETIKNEGVRIDAQLALLEQRQKEIERSISCEDYLGVVMISEPASSLEAARRLTDVKMQGFGDSLLNHLHGSSRLIKPPRRPRQ